MVRFDIPWFRKKMKNSIIWNSPKIGKMKIKIKKLRIPFPSPLSTTLSRLQRSATSAQLIKPNLRCTQERGTHINPRILIFMCLSSWSQFSHGSTRAMRSLLPNLCSSTPRWVRRRGNVIFRFSLSLYAILPFNRIAKWEISMNSFR